MTIDISISKEWPSCALSNRAPNEFIFDGVLCYSMESLLQSFQFDNRVMQHALCQKSGPEARVFGREAQNWQRLQVLFWKGYSYDRRGPAYQGLLNQAYDALAQNASFQRALLETGMHDLTHKTGATVQELSVITVQEFIPRLLKRRKLLQVKFGVQYIDQ
jgi:hypothetical protein